MNTVWGKKDRPFRDTIWVESGTGRLEKGRKVQDNNIGMEILERVYE